MERLAASPEPLVRELAEFARTSTRGFAHAGATDDDLRAGT
jgi:hypothetical protein